MALTHVCRRGAFEDALQQAGPEFRQRLVQVESRAPVVLSQVRVEISIESGVLGVQVAEGGQRLLEGAFGATVQLSKVRW